jgi:light-regulated signal transduction histidine kinase (bacteriophytochrome)
VLTTRAAELTTITRYDLRQPDWEVGGLEQRFWRALNSPVLSADGRLRYIIHRVEDAAPPPQPAPAVAERPTFEVHPRRNKVELQLLRSARDRDEAMRRLRSANEELEAFSYSASHDLRAPLRTVEGFCKLLGEQPSVAEDPIARHFLANVESGVHRMGATLDGLLALSQVGKAKMTKKRVDMTALARHVIDEMRARYPSRNVSVEIAPDLETYADERLALVALEHVVGNAWKFTSKTDEPRIEIGQHVFAGEKVFYVKDNGAGFDMSYASRLFTAFVRLHGVSEFEGHGIGLATVKRVVERHDGRVWAESQPGQGASISFTFGV